MCFGVNEHVSKIICFGANEYITKNNKCCGLMNTYQKIICMFWVLTCIKKYYVLGANEHSISKCQTRRIFSSFVRGHPPNFRASCFFYETYCIYNKGIYYLYIAYVYILKVCVNNKGIYCIHIY